MSYSTQQLDSHQLQEYADHLLKLDATDRYLRFGHQATDEQIQHYVDSQFRSRQTVIGAFNENLELVAAVELVFETSKFTRTNKTVEIGLSVLPEYRRQGIGSELFKQAAAIAQGQGASTIFCHCLSENDCVKRMAERSGLNINVAPTDQSSGFHYPDLIGRAMAMWDYTQATASSIFNYGAMSTFPIKDRKQAKGQ